MRGRRRGGERTAEQQRAEDGDGLASHRDAGVGESGEEELAEWTRREQTRTSCADVPADELQCLGTHSHSHIVRAGGEHGGDARVREQRRRRGDEIGNAAQERRARFGIAR